MVFQLCCSNKQYYLQILADKISDFIPKDNKSDLILKKKTMSIKKQYLKSESVCKLTFKVSKEQAQDAETVKILGDFNNWDKEVEPMSKLKNGDFTQTLKLEAGSEYQFRYLINGTLWINEDEADKTVPNGVAEGEFNSVLAL